MPFELPPSLWPGPFTVATALDAGVSAKALRGRRFTAPHRGVRQVAGAPTDLRAAIDAARLILPPDALVTGVSGLQVFGVDVGSTRPLRFVTAHPHQIRRPGIVVTRVASLPERWNDLVVLPEHCWMVAARELDLVQLVTAGDWLLQLRFTYRQGLADYLHGRRDHGVGPARKALPLLRDRVRSPRESWLRLCLVLAGLPEPEVNPTVRVAGRRGEVDLVYHQFRILIEYDGDQHRIDREQWNIDIERHELFTGGGWTILRVTAERARRPRWIVERVHALLCAAGYAGPAPTFSARWRALFD